MPEKELMHDLHEKREIRKNVADRQKDIDKSKDDTKDDLEVYMAAKDMISRYRLAYRLNLVEPGQAWKIHADQILRSNVSNNLVDHRKLYRKYLRLYPEAAKRANIVLSNFDSLKKEIDNDITKLKKLIDSKRFYRVWNIWPNLDRIASRINTAEEKVRIKAEKEISQQNTSSLVEESAKEMATKQTQKWREKVAPKMYMKRDWDRFIFTKESNPVKIHEVMSAFIKEKPEAVFLLDYNWCIGNDSLKADIRRRTRNSSWKVYIKYNQKIKTYDFFDWTTMEPLWGKRPYIWEWVTMISKEVEWLVAQKQQQDRLDASTNINYAKLANNLEKNFAGQIKILQDIKLTRSSSFWDEIRGGKRWNKMYPNRAKDFLVCVETRLNDVVNKWRARAYLDNKNPIDTGWWILQVRLITSSGDLTKVPLFVKDSNRGAARWWLPDYLYEYISHRKSQTQEYLTRRLNEIWWERKHMERRDSDVGYEKQSLSTDEKLREKQKKDIEKNKDLKKYWIDSLLDMLAQLEKDKHTPPEIWPLLAHVEGIKKSLENSPKNSLPSKATWDAAIKETQRLYIVYKNNDGRFATITDATAKKLIEQIFNAKSRVEVQNARSELWNWMTFFDNSSRSWAVSDYADDMMESNQSYYKNWWKDGKGLLEIVDEDNKWYNDCYQNICRLTYIDVDEKTGEITGPQENKKFIDDLMACDDRISLGTLLKSKNLIPKNLEKEDSNKYYEICTTILKTIENKREMENKFELTADDMKKSYMAEINELQKKTSLTDEEMARMALLMCIIEDDEGLKESAKGQTQIGKDTIRYWWIDSLLDEHITPYLAKKWGWFKWGNEAMTRNYNDSKWLRWWWDRTDENCEKIWPVLKEILTEVVITAVAIWLWAVTWWLWTAAVAWLRTLAGGARIASIWNKVKNFTRIAKLCEKMWKWAKYCKKLKSTAKAKIWWKVGNTRLWNAYSRVRGASGTRVVGENLAKNTWRTMATLTSETRVWRTVAHAAEWTKWTKLRKAGKSIWDIVKAWNIARTQWSLWMKAVWMIFEWTWFHVASTALHNAIEGRDIFADLNPVDNFRWYVQSIAFLWMLKFLWRPINTMTSTSMESVMWQKISVTQFWKALKYVAWLWWEFWGLVATDQALSIIFDWKFKGMTVDEAIHSIGMILWLRLLWKAKEIKNLTIKEYNKAKKELKVDFWEWEVVLKEDEILWWNSELLNDRIKDKATEQIHEDFDKQIMSPKWITINWITYKLERRPNEWHNPNRKWRIVYTETWPDWKIKVKIEANSDTFVLPENSNWNRIRERFNSARGKYVERNLNSTLESARNELDWEFTRDIDSKSKDLEWRKKDRVALEWKKKNLSDEINWLKSRKAQLEQQLQNISKELIQQQDIVSLQDIYSIIKEWNKVSIWWKKMKFIWVKWDKIVFTEWGWKTKEFSSFKELNDAKVNFNIDIKSRQWDRWLEQQIMFEELVWKEARTSNANEIIREYESLQRQKSQIEQDIRDWFFRENAGKLKWRHIRIDGVEYQCTDVKINNGKTTLDFKKTDWSDSFTISSFEQLKSKWQVNGFWDRYDVIDKETRAAWRELSRHERENHELLRGENWLFKWENKYVENKKQELQQIDQQLQNGRADYDNAKLATSPKKVPNLEYERIQKEIEWIDAQLIEKWQQLTSIERDLWASDTEIARLEQEITNLTAERENLSINENEIWNRESNRWNEWSEWNHIETVEEIKTSEDIANKLNEIKSEPESGDFENVKLDWVTKAQFETWVFIEWVHRRFKNLSLKPNMKMSKEFLKKMRDGLVDMKNKWWEKLSEYHRKLVDKRNKFLERKLSENWDEVWIKEEEIKQLEEQEMRDNNIKDTDSPQEIADKLENSIENNTDFEIGKEAFVSWKFMEWIRNWFNKIIQKPDISLPKDSIKRLKNKISEMMKNRGNELSDGYKRLVERFDRYLNDLLKQPWEKIKIMRQEKRIQKEQQRREREWWQRLNSERPEWWINTERREMSEVQRNSDVVAIWDLHWEYVALKWNMEYAWLAREVNWHLEWIGWNKKVVFQWDILADRWTDWLRIIKEIHQLREQARKQWWDIDIIVGNHDDFMISYLTWRNWIHRNGLDVAIINSQWRWITELAKFIWRKVWDFDDLYEKGTRGAILQAMRNSPEWRIILEEICNMKLVSQVDDVLYIHTNPTDAILNFLTSSWKWNIQQMINAINTKYQNYLREMLLWEWKISDEWLREFNWLSDLFLNTSNRTTSRQLDYYNKLKNSGINMISHWHSWGSENLQNMYVINYNQQFLYKNNQANIWWIKIVDTDYSYWKWWKNGGQHSVSIVKKEWWINYIWDNVAYANIEYPIWSEVYVERTEWWESRARIISFDPNTQKYRVIWNEWWKQAYKDVTSENLRMAS